jgi:hypothetical protein
MQAVIFLPHHFSPQRIDIGIGIDNPPHHDIDTPTDQSGTATLDDDGNKRIIQCSTFCRVIISLGEDDITFIDKMSK